MPKKSRVRTLMDIEHVKGYEKLLKSSRQYFSQIFLSLWKEIISKGSVSILCEILRQFVKILTPDDKYSLSIKASV